jgi:glycosyltransferase involved in cell wall biosynthesis
MRGEILFVNDGSRDGSLAVIRELSTKDGRVYINLSRNFGRRRLCLRASTMLMVTRW